MADSKTRQDIYKMSLDNLVVPESEEELNTKQNKTSTGMSKDKGPQ